MMDTKKKQQYLSDPKSVTGTVFPAQKVKLVTGCYLNVVPCRQSKNHIGLKTDQHLSSVVQYKKFNSKRNKTAAKDTEKTPRLNSSS